jgi:hypothetical protein
LGLGEGLTTPNRKEKIIFLGNVHGLGIGQTLTRPKQRKMDMKFGRFEVFMSVNIQVSVFWVLTPCSVAVGYQHFGQPFCFHLQRENGGSKVSKALVSCRNTIRRHNSEDLELKLDVNNNNDNGMYQ